MAYVAFDAVLQVQ